MKTAKYEPIFNRKNKLRKDGKATVQIRVYKNRERRYFSTGVNVLPSQWDPNQWVINHPDADGMNARIRKKIHELEEFEYKSRAQGEIFDLSMITAEESKSGDFSLYMKAHIEEERMSAGTRRQHKTTLNHLIAFGKIIKFSQVTRNRIREFDQYLHGMGLQQSSVYGNHKRLKKWVNMAMDEGYISADPYRGFSVPAGNRGSIKYLDAEQLKKLEEKDMPLPRLEEVRDVFLFCCYTGLAYQEVEALTYNNLKEEDGTTWVVGFRPKVMKNHQTTATGEYLVPLMKKAVNLVEKYRGVREGYVLPVITNQKYNAFLKEVASLAGIDLHLTTHVARHTFATTVTLTQGVPIETVSKMLGHSSVKMTEVYAKVIKDRVKKDMERIL